MAFYLPEEKCAQGRTKEDQAVTLEPTSIESLKRKEKIAQTKILAHEGNTLPNIIFHISPPSKMCLLHNDTSFLLRILLIKLAAIYFLGTTSPARLVIFTFTNISAGASKHPEYNAMIFLLKQLMSCFTSISRLT